MQVIYILFGLYLLTNDFFNINPKKKHPTVPIILNKEI